MTRIDFSGGKELNQTFLGDPDIRSKIDFGARTNFLIHGWLSGLDGGNMHLPEEVRATDGRSLNHSNQRSQCTL